MHRRISWTEYRVVVPWRAYRLIQADLPSRVGLGKIKSGRLERGSKGGGAEATEVRGGG